MSETALTADQAERVRLIILDVDGVLTDGGVYMGASGGDRVELKRFHISDGLGIRMLVDGGVDVVIVSGRESAATTLRAAELGIECHQQPGGFKLGAAERLLAERSLDWTQVAVMADDLADLPIVQRAGLAIAPANAVAEILAASDHVTRRGGGEGAVREFAETLLHARGAWTELVERYCAQREAGDPVSGDGARGSP